jgi:lipid-binding SYLF domain-containing protein
MKRYILCTLRNAGLVLGAECDCNHFPIAPDSCVKSCGASGLIQQAIDAVQSVVRGDDLRIRNNLRDATCIAAIQTVRASGFIVGGSRANGFVSCRKQMRGLAITGLGLWSAPVAITTKPSKSLSNAEFTILAVTNNPLERFTGNNLNLGREAFAATTDRHGSWDSIDLSASKIEIDVMVNKELYGANASPKSILEGGVEPDSAAAKYFQRNLDRLFR